MDRLGLCKQCKPVSDQGLFVPIVVRFLVSPRSRTLGICSREIVCQYEPDPLLANPLKHIGAHIDRSPMMADDPFWHISGR